MANQFYFENKLVTCENNYVNDCVDVATLKQHIFHLRGISVDDLYVTINGKIASGDIDLRGGNNVVRVCTRLVGGKGGFGSMLRAIGAQIEKTTNREACRDLSGRRLRDINEEKRLRKWLEGQEDREREAAERKVKKLERLLAEPTIKLDVNPEYEKKRQELPERVSAAVDAGWQAAGSSGEGGTKRKAVDDKPKGNKKKKLWIDADMSDCSSLSEDEEVEEKPKLSPGQMVSTDSGNESDQTAKKAWCAIFLMSLIMVASARPQDLDDGDSSNDRSDDIGRVQIKVYRGPTKDDGHAPWGFWVKQPSDD